MNEKATQKLQEESGRESARKALEQIRRTPAKPFPDAGAHAWRAFGEAVFRAWSDIQRIAESALGASATDGPGYSHNAAVAEPIAPEESDTVPSKQHSSGKTGAAEMQANGEGQLMRLRLIAGLLLLGSPVAYSQSVIQGADKNVTVSPGTLQVSGSSDTSPGFDGNKVSLLATQKYAYTFQITTPGLYKMAARLNDRSGAGPVTVHWEFSAIFAASIHEVHEASVVE